MSNVNGPPGIQKIADGFAVIVPPTYNRIDRTLYPRQAPGWIDVIETGIRADAEVELPLGKGAAPVIRERTPIYLFSQGILRGRVLAAGLTNGADGFAVVITGAAIAMITAVTVPRDTLLVRWEEATGHATREFWWLGAREAWWKLGDEQPFPAWAFAGLPPELSEIGRSFVGRFVRPGAAPPPAAPAKTQPQIVEAPSFATPAATPATERQAAPRATKKKPPEPAKPPQGSLF